MNLRTAAFVVTMAFGISCASHCGDRAYTRVVHEQTEAYAYSAGADAIWKETSSILGELGHEFAAATPTEAPALSKWQGEPDDRHRFSVRIIESKTNRLEVYKLSETEVPTYADMEGRDQSAPPRQTGTRLQRDRRRDHNIEWQVLRRLDPARAAEIERMAMERREEVEDVVSRGCT